MPQYWVCRDYNYGFPTLDSVSVKNTLILEKDSVRSTKRVVKWRHNIYLWRHNGAQRHARAKHYEYFMLENCTQTTRVYWSKNPFELLYIYIW